MVTKKHDVAHELHNNFILTAMYFKYKPMLALLILMALLVRNIRTWTYYVFRCEHVSIFSFTVSTQY